MDDFGALNSRRLRTLQALREMVDEEAALRGRYFGGPRSAETIEFLESNRMRFRELWSQHQEIRRQMVDAGFMPPPLPSEGLLESPAEDPVRHQLEDKLKTELDAARRDYYCASQEFRVLLAKGTGLPAPDGSLRAKQIAAVHSAALHNYTSAIRRFNAFLAVGKLPKSR